MTAQPRWLTPRLPNFRTDGVYCREFIESFCRISKGEHAGQLTQLRNWQGDILDDLYELRPDGRRRYRVGLVGMPRKNSKSLIGSGVALYGLIADGEPGAEVYSAAGDKEQARIVFGEAKKMVEADPDLNEVCKCYKDAIEVPSTGSVYRVLSAEAFTKEGLNPSLVIFDELHVQPTDELWDVLNLGSGTRRNPLVVGITTAGARFNSAGVDSLCFRLYEHGKKVVTGEEPDEFFYFRWYEPEDPAGCNHRDPEVWASCNPGFGDFLYEDDFASVSSRMPEPEFRTKRLNVWVTSSAQWLPTGAWEEREDPERELVDIPDVVLGFDGSHNGDSTALVACTVPDDGNDPHLIVVNCWERPADAGDDWAVSVLDVEEAIREACRIYQVRRIVADPFRWNRSLQLLEDEGLPVEEFPQTPQRMTPATARFYEAVINKTLTHDGDPRLARHIGNAVLRTDSRGSRLWKEGGKKSTRRIDLAVAAVMAHQAACEMKPQGIDFFVFSD